MPQPYDAAAKDLVSPERAADWLALTGRQFSGSVEVLEADVSTVSRRADRVFKVRDESPWIWHLELQANADPSLPVRLNVYNALLEKRYALPVWTTVVLLRRQANRPELTGVLEQRLRGESPYRLFRYQVVRVWELAPEVLLEGGLGIVPLAPLGSITRQQLPAIIGRMDERISAAAPAERAKLWTATAVLMGMRYPKSLIEEFAMLAEVLKASSVYRGAVAEGLAKGRAEGALSEARKLLLRLGGKHLGKPDAKIRTKLDALTDLERLERMSERVFEASSWQELLKTR